jgi:exodeoxyribonuclease-3
VRIATWNVNSLAARLPRVLAWLQEASPDVVCLQETKMTDAAFPAGAFAELGYESAHHGQGQWNGVAVLSRLGLRDVQREFGGVLDEAGSRLVAAWCGPVRVHSVYVPNGRSVASEHFAQKLEFLRALRAYLERSARPEELVCVCGDMNVAPEDRDVWDPAALAGSTHVTPEEREALGGLFSWGLVDALRAFTPASGIHSWWDYRGGAFHRRRGLRIDLVLVSRPLAERCQLVVIDRNERKGERPSDHAPVLVELDLDQRGTDR